MHLCYYSLVLRVAIPDHVKAKRVPVKQTPASQTVEALAQEYGKLVFHTIYGMIGDWEESQELTQETFLHALKGIDAARSASGSQFHAKAWLLRIALNTVHMQQRRRMLFRFIPFSRLHTERDDETKPEKQGTPLSWQERPAAVQPVGYGNSETSDPAEMIAERDAVRRALAALPESLRICLLLSVVGGLSSAEIAQMLDLKEPAVRQRIARARKQFQQAYTQESGETVFEGPAPDPAGQTSQTDAPEKPISRRTLIHARPLLQSNR